MARRRTTKLSSEAKRIVEGTRREGGMFFAQCGLGTDDIDAIDDAGLVLTFESRKLLVRDLANLRDGDAVSWFWGKYGAELFPEHNHDLMELRDDLRSIWMSDKRPVNRVLNKWLRWRPTKVHAKPYEKTGFSQTIDDYQVFTCSVSAKRLVPNLLSLRATLVQGVFEHWGRLKFCANRDCAAPYFIAKRSDQRVCDAGACKAERQREKALRWWNENRAKKTLTKGRSNNGARKKR